MIPFRTFISILIFTVALTSAATLLFEAVISNFSAHIFIVSNGEADGTPLTACLEHPSPAWTFTRLAVQPVCDQSGLAGQKSRGTGRNAKSARTQKVSHYEITHNYR
jgi:hypothetical protein